MSLLILPFVIPVALMAAAPFIFFGVAAFAAIKLALNEVQEVINEWERFD